MKYSLPKAVALIASLFSAGCTQPAVMLANLPTHFSTMQVHTNISYGPKNAQKLDVYTPKKPQKDTPVVIFFYGGGWHSGSKSYYRFMAQTLVNEGYIVVIPDYRQYPEVTFPAFMDDAANALAWVQKNIDDYNGDVENIALMGHSAGAHMAVLLMADKTYIKNAQTNMNGIQAVLGIAGPYSFTPEEDVYVKIFGPPRRFPQMQVDTFINGSEPPMLLTYGLNDTVVHVSNQEKLTEAINKHSGKVEAKTYNGIGHIGILRPFSWAAKSNHPIKEDVLTFLGKYLKN